MVRMGGNLRDELLYLLWRDPPCTVEESRLEGDVIASVTLPVLNQARGTGLVSSATPIRCASPEFDGGSS